ncbi:hypothetical protein [Micromonospora chersina]|uniref:imine reductase family protein n=1 Tax=Micromonospora chersina TaxID=47854 RepID=UPI00371B43F0
MLDQHLLADARQAASKLGESAGAVVAASADQGVGTDVLVMVQRLMRRQIDTGHGQEGFARIIESIRQPR